MSTVRTGDRQDLTRMLGRWQDHGLITAEQAAAILATEGSQEETGGRRSLVGEALGYAGGLLMVVAVAFFGGTYWTRLATSGRLALTAAVVVVLGVAGWLVPAVTAAGVRLRSVLWLLSVAAAAAFFGILGDDGLGWSEADIALLAGAGAAAYAGLLWWRAPQALQVIAWFPPLAVAVGAAASRLPLASDALAQAGVGAAVWLAAVAWVALGWWAVLRPRAAVVALGATGMVVGSEIATAVPAGHGLALATAAALLVAAVLSSDLVLLVVGAAALLIAVPHTVTRFAEGVLAVPAGLFAAGLLLVAAALWFARRRPDRHPAHS